MRSLIQCQLCMHGVVEIKYVFPWQLSQQFTDEGPWKQTRLFLSGINPRWYCPLHVKDRWRAYHQLPGKELNLVLLFWVRRCESRVEVFQWCPWQSVFTDELIDSFRQPSLVRPWKIGLAAYCCDCRSGSLGALLLGDFLMQENHVFTITNQKYYLLFMIVWMLSECWCHACLLANYAYDINKHRLESQDLHRRRQNNKLMNNNIYKTLSDTIYRTSATKPLCAQISPLSTTMKRHLMIVHDERIVFSDAPEAAPCREMQAPLRGTERASQASSISRWRRKLGRHNKADIHPRQQTDGHLRGAAHRLQPKVSHRAALL